jgi:predicted TIM-barrel fold metal-dependent hydrolase
MNVEKAAEAIRAFKPKVVYPYHFRGGDGTKADFGQLRKLVGEDSGVEIRVRDWYPERYPWIGETGAIAKRYSNVWIDSVWMPVINYTMARRAYEEWLDAVASDRILWGSDEQTPEGVYGATQTTRRCLAEALAEKVQRGELREEHAVRIGQQVLRENALALFPQLKERRTHQKEQTSQRSGR